MSLQKVLSSLAVISLIFLPLVASANSYIPGVGPDSSLPEYIKAIYSYAIGVVGILATVVIMIGGIIWISSMGNAGRVSEAKAWIGAALTGLALAMFSYTILYIVNPDLVNFQWQGPQTINTGSGQGPTDSGYSNDFNFNTKCENDYHCGTGFGCTASGVCVENNPSDCAKDGADCHTKPCCSGTCEDGYCKADNSSPDHCGGCENGGSCRNTNNGYICYIMDGCSSGECPGDRYTCTYGDCTYSP